MACASDNKLILAVLQGEDYHETVDELTQQGFFVTLLSSTGGFLKKKNTTVMIGTQADKLDLALDILRKKAGRRRETVHQTAPIFSGPGATMPLASIPFEQDVGGVSVFVLDLEQIKKF